MSFQAHTLQRVGLLILHLRLPLKPFHVLILRQNAAGSGPFRTQDAEHVRFNHADVSSCNTER